MMQLFKRKNKMVQMVENIISPPKIATVEEIHAEFDSAEARILNQCDAILAELKIPTETQIEKKAKQLKELGFINTETVEQALVLKERSIAIENKISLTKKQVDSIKYYKQKYPFEKFIPVDELDRICEKYNLIHAPAANYIKDIPEKNVLEMVNCKKLEINDKEEEKILITHFEFWKGATEEYQNFIKTYLLNKEFFINKEVLDSEGLFSKFIKELGFSDVPGSIYWFKEIKSEIINRAGFFIAAPISHFNLKDLDKKSQYGYFNVEKYEVKDPVVYEYCNNGICRIVTKWGTDDDKSYLDPILLNEIEN